MSGRPMSALGEAEQAPAGVVDEDEAVAGVQHGDALVDEIDDGLQAGGLGGHLALEPGGLGDVVEHREHAG